VDALERVRAATQGARRVHPCKETVKRKGWTQRALARLWGVNQSTASRMLRDCSKRTAILVDGLDNFGGND